MEVPEKVLYTKNTRPRDILKRGFRYTQKPFVELTDEEIDLIYKDLLERHGDDLVTTKDEIIGDRNKASMSSNYYQRFAYITYEVKNKNSARELNAKSKQNKDLDIPKLTVALNLPNGKCYADIFYCSNKANFKHVERMAIQVSERHIRPPNILWKKPTTFPRFVVVVRKEGAGIWGGSTGLGELEADIDEIENYIKAVLFMDLKDWRRSDFTPEAAYRFLNISLSKPSKILIQKFIDKYKEQDE